jgi:hypothetical protein
MHTTNRTPNALNALATRFRECVAILFCCRVAALFCHRVAARFRQCAAILFHCRAATLVKLPRLGLPRLCRAAHPT